MSAAAEDKTKIVDRLRGIPAHANTFDDARRLLVQCFPGFNSDDVDIQSLASGLDYWEQPPSKVATLRLRRFPDELAHASPEIKSWDLSGLGAVGNTLILDHDFLGLTPLNDVNASEHIADCVALSGLGSHPFGSWQPHGPHKDFMWIRDEAPLFARGVRMILYGHDSSVVQSNSFQLISDIARDFIEHLRLGGWSFPFSKPLLFMAHSLGGLVLKDALVQMTDAKNELDANMVKKIQGAIFFGVPNLGMEQTYLQAMVQGQPNETLIQDLSRNSNYLLRLDESFSGTAFLRNLTIFWAYEMIQSHTVIPSKDGRGWDRKGPLAILVSQCSATCRQLNPSMAFPIQSNHSDMVKFGRGQNQTKIVCSKLLAIAHCYASNPREMGVPNEVGISSPQLDDEVSLQNINNESAILASLNAPDLDFRQVTIDENFEATFEWAFEHEEFITWLSRGSGLFWINGKPGSGKSTLMKFLFKHQRTKDFLYDWKSETQYNLAGFFFHHRGSLMQKSFEGLLRSLLRQIIQQQPDLCEYLRPFFTETKVLPAKKKWTLSELGKALRGILTQKQYLIKLCLFLDALDEFYGHPDMICGFLTDLMDMQDQSRFQLKLCFSSRPWDVFERAFSRFPKFSLQDHTQADIRDYCIGMIAQADIHANYLEDLVPDIVQRASGVFLWVSLVVKDLSNAIMDPDQRTKSLDDLRTFLDALPLELDSYYRRIIERMANTHCWETFVLLELLTRRSEFPHILSTSQVVGAVRASQCATQSEASRMIRSFYGDEVADDPAIESRKVWLWGGGLVEEKDGYVQVMHQTVFEFVTSLEFKKVVLGKRAKITRENGHVFHMKALFSLNPPPHLESEPHIKMAAEHAHQAEITTGISQYRFIKSIPKTRLEFMRAGKSSRTTLNFACWAGLTLFLRDTEESELATPPLHTVSSISAKSGRTASGTYGYHVPDGLIQSCFYGMVLDLHDNFALVVKILLAKGYNRREEEVLSEILGKLLRPIKANFEQSCINAYLVLLDYGWPLENNFPYSYETVEDGWIFPLHTAPPKLAERLLDLGANPNPICSSGYTPLDTCLDIKRGKELNRIRSYYDYTSAEALEYIFQLASILLSRGGKLRRTKPRTYLTTLAWFEKFLPERYQALEYSLRSVGSVLDEEIDEEVEQY